ncbi:MAG: class I SAM-dependent methyltransferase [Rhodospirillaceae bacterium]|nr:class I SAM-dependent methyltransferase [Rhodospirillaceae bacterium]
MADTQEISENLEQLFSSGNFLTRLNFRFFSYLSGLGSMPKSTRVLDCGCATGFLLQYITSLGFTQADGIDSSAPMAKAAEARTSGTVFVNDIAKIPDYIPANSYDVVIASGVIHHLTTQEEWKKFFSGCRHALKTGGTFISRP